MSLVERQRRILMLVHDGAGLGHLRRIARVAAALQGPAAALVVTGMREAAWVVPPNVEVLRLPSWDGFSARRAEYYGRAVWLSVSREEAMSIRRTLLSATVAAFRPDAVLVDYLPFGHRDEWRELLASNGFRKYYVLRGVIDTSDHFLRGAESDALGRTFDRILVTAESRVVDVVREYGFGHETASKTLYVGYVAPQEVDRKLVRHRHKIREGAQWVVVSAGGGKRAESFIRDCINVAATLPEVTFDIVFGPRANISPPSPLNQPRNCRVWTECQELPQLHASCDVAVVAGGYNSLLEAARGGARVIVRSSYSGTDDEQRENARRLGALHPILLLNDAAALRDVLIRELAAARVPTSPIKLQFDGENRIRQVVLNDLCPER